MTKCAAAVAALVALELLSCRDASPPPSVQPSTNAIFVDRAVETGLDFTHQSGACGQLYIAEVIGSGAALFDYDNDGDLDAYLIQGGELDLDHQCPPIFPSPQTMLPHMDRLYRNDLRRDASGQSHLRFVDVTAESGILATEYGMGVAAGDYDNDGWIDLYVTNLGPNKLYRNEGDGTFRDLTIEAGADDRRWSTSASFVDFDADGWLDLYVTNYIEWSIAGRQHCQSLTGAPDYCNPMTYRPSADRFFRNRGDGTFDNLLWGTAVAAKNGSGLGVASGDFNGDGRFDLYVANDGMPNFLWTRNESGGLIDEGMASGSALNREGQAEAGMGIAAADFDGDGDEDLLVTHLALETNTLYRNLGTGVFDDESAATGIGTASWPFTGFGTVWIDVDNDGWLDLVTVNGAVKTIMELAEGGDPYPLGMRNQLFRNLEGRRLEEISDRAGASFTLSEVSRGLAAGDVDNDGDIDLLLANNNGPARLLINGAGHERPWIGFRVLGRSARSDRLGAWVGVVRSGQPTLYRRARTDGSYLSASDPRVLVGLGGSPHVDMVVVRWPDGSWERFDASVEQYNDLVQGTGLPVDGVQ